MTKMLIMSALSSPDGYARQVFQTFAGSLLATGFDGDITIMTSHNEATSAELSSLPQEYEGLRFSTIPVLKEYRDINCYRYRYYLEYLAPRVQDYEYVMLSDARDVFFQRDISHFPFDSDVDMFFAQEEKLIGECPINSGWILDLYGAECLSELKTRPVLCSGTTIGSPKAIIKYLNAMIEHVERVDTEFHNRFGYLGGIDQGIHNFLFYKGVLTELHIKPMHNSENMVYTIGHVAQDDKQRAFLNSEHKFINREGNLCYCVHQHDRLDEDVRRAFNQHSRFSI
jgi:hypothetical protein